MSELLAIAFTATILLVLISCWLLFIMTMGVLILHRKISSKWVHCHECDSWRKIETESEEEEQTEE